MTTGGPFCADCKHSADHHGARGYGACRFGFRGVIASLLTDEQVTAQGFPDECRCKRFRVRPRKASVAKTS